MTTTLKPPASLPLAGLLPRPPGRLPAYAAVAGAAFVAYILSKVLEGGPARVFEVFGVSACGWAWLLTRALFDPARQDAWWPRLVAGVVAVSGAATVLWPNGGPVSDVAENLYALSGSAALVLTLVEPFQRHGCAISGAERRFRRAFGLIFLGLVSASVLAAWSAPEPVKVVSALVGLAAAGAAVTFRLRHPLSLEAPEKKQATAEDRRLADRLMRLLQEDAIHTEPELRIADVARRLNEPEHRVSRAISAGLGFANFNRLINHHRVEQAKQALASDDDRSILEIALDCGFGSIGPFNRAFKAETGMTPKAYRAGRRQAD
ncbi:AraC family transcriptional regulator [Caulobacter sp. NIBR1757]|uniref:helix-turn-helix domain-containing protein n=1 Tax=Caulobacter sp. NIBR1757 TaxID=3016000 RepID=UPI0022F04717|nr:AraC family transcriptional regulator [Caulobacter sp. NIBR1757]WGM39660.1 hypothetical protein AMEJIAPC_02585 [Caulobacter sp. NIBR1757]